MSSISSRSLSMSSLIFVPFLASSALPLPPSPHSAGLLGRVSFSFCCSGICLSVPSAFSWTRERQRHRLRRTIPSHLRFALPSPYVVTGTATTNRPPPSSTRTTLPTPAIRHDVTSKVAEQPAYPNQGLIIMLMLGNAGSEPSPTVRVTDEENRTGASIWRR